jgi:ubiquinone/menaquinone biosynthesis C-methylase UbiE
MFNNLFNVYDVLKVLGKVKEGRLQSVLRKIYGKKNEKIADAWQHIQSPPVDWLNIPAVKERLNTLISGNAGVNHRSYIKQTYLNGRKNLSALSLGCGAGQDEIAWAETGIFKRIDAFDLSPNRIRQAATSAIAKGCEHITKFSVCDAQKKDIGTCEYDLVLFEGSLHHFSPVAEILHKVNRSLKPGGYVVVYDFVGPSRFQWTKRQVEIANFLLTILPVARKIEWDGKNLKKRVRCPGRLFMALSDPSEAAGSATILPCLKQIFEVIEIKEIGGTILHLLFSGIAHNFRDENPETREWLKLCFEVEDIMMKTKEISSDFVLAVGKPKHIS